MIATAIFCGCWLIAFGVEAGLKKVSESLDKIAGELQLERFERESERGDS